MKLTADISPQKRFQFISNINWNRVLYYAIAIFLMVIFFWLAYVSIADYSEAIRKMGDQVFPDRWVPFLTAINLVVQIAIALLLFVGLFRTVFLIYGLGLATLLLAVYTAYSELAVLKLLGRTPCSCIGWLENQDWKGVFTVSVILLLFSLIALLITLKERGMWKKKLKRKHP